MKVREVETNRIKMQRIPGRQREIGEKTGIERKKAKGNEIVRGKVKKSEREGAGEKARE